MKNFAIIENGNIVNVIVCEALIIAQSLLPDAILMEETELTGNAVIGGTVLNGGFIPPKPYESWTLNSETKSWDPPTPYPSVKIGEYANWNEDAEAWEILAIPFNEGN